MPDFDIILRVKAYCADQEEADYVAAVVKFEAMKVVNVKDVKLLTLLEEVGPSGS